MNQTTIAGVSRMGGSERPNQVGAPDPEKRTSPIFDETDRDFLSMDLELETGVCYFNNRSYEVGSYVCSGSEMLHCQGRGVWLRAGTCELDESE
jgi:hypothetical protein